ncbi:cGMP-inhibited 3',5'-cyclic phosphodiesterase 3A [Parasteatoda tepidariorum]|uniref:cGMP-inhibited 3',5'-cyclic phosphodiesterase 3A n=1 Tax=Parasteatoda tepidariorum TaxID=114398 RepID=UPI001C727407|nr:cGMP-inhibited 3',5'-cyclic phosphodiesterase A [Parasteatoda tepidariorum]
MPPWADTMGNTQPRAGHHHHHHQQQQQQHQREQQSHHHHQRRNRRESSVDLAAVTEAHGLVSDMLADPQLPPHIVTGLRTLSSLLSPAPATASASSSCCAPPRMHHRRSPQRRKGSLILPYFRSTSDNEEIPFTGERPSALPKRLRKNLAPSVLRRMSTATWTTTTTATGMPTLEPEPLRKRSTSFRNLQSPPPTGSINDDDQIYQENNNIRVDEEERQFSPGLESLIAALPEQQKRPPKGQRSYSTTALPSGHPKRKDSRGRKTVASLHPLTPHDVKCLTSLHEDATRRTGEEQEADEGIASKEPQDETIKEEEEDEDEDEEEGLAPLPSFRRSAAMSSDYESSDSPPSGPEDAGGRRILRTHASVQTTATWGGKGPCALCGRSAPFTPSPLTIAPLASSEQEITEEDSEEEGLIIQLQDAVYDLEALANDPLLGLIDIWDFPVFDMERQAGTLILSQMCYRVFLATGLFESFRIPMLPFFAYFHELEKGYRDKPYHNRMHASDVLHGVYFLISQPIPGFCQVSSDSTDSPLHRTLSGREAQERWSTSRQATVDNQIKSFIDDEDEDDESDDEKDVYGVMGANFPALEIMALYAAAAMHDYDHPGRTNAFIVATLSPQAILYNDRSVLENHHSAAAWSLLLSDNRYNWLRYLDEAEFKRFRFLVIELILATDLKRHFDIVTDFSAKMSDEESPPLDWASEADRLLVMQMAIKLSDINGPCKCRQLHMQWTHRIAEEFYEQGDEERSLGFPISRYMDREKPQLAKLQESFIGHLVAPLCRSYAEAALLPGVWVRLSHDQSAEELSEDDLDLPRRVEEIIIGGKQKKQPLSRVRRKVVHCQQTKNLQDNYDYWMAVQRREEEQQSQVSTIGTTEPCT